ncbi:MAG TPA: response regulator [Anaeromyxobacteraceae bacterium]|nr:response regulator [Anaeromyxobacteraceae bacterium]
MPKNLLLADDSITIQKVVGITFAGEDFKITAVDNGEDAIARAKELRPDVILADVVMPRKNGYEVCEAVKADPALRHIPVLLLAGTFEAFDESRARSAKADGHIAKPFESQALLARVKDLISSPASAPGPAERVAARAPAVAAPVRPLSAPPPTARPAVPAPPAAARPLEPPRAPAAPPRPTGLPPFRAPMPKPAQAIPGARPFPAPEIVRAAPLGPPPGLRPPLPQRPPVAAPVAPPPAMRPAAPSARELAPTPPVAPARPPPPEPPGVLPPLAAGAHTERGALEAGELDLARKARPAPSAPPVVPAATATPPAPDAIDLDFGDLDVTETTEAPVSENSTAIFTPLAAPARLSTPVAPVQPSPEPPVPGAAITALEDIDFGLPGPAPAARAAPLAEPPQEPMDLPLLEVDEEVELVPVSDLGVSESESEDRFPPDVVAPPVAELSLGEEKKELSGAAADGGEAGLREALSRASREVIEKIAWEVVPQLAETIIREHLDRLVKDRQG